MNKPDEIVAAEPPLDCHVGRKWMDTDSLAYALECAADFLDAEEWPEDDGGAQVAANREAARRIRRMVRRLVPNAGGEATGAALCDRSPRP